MGKYISSTFNFIQYRSMNFPTTVQIIPQKKILTILLMSSSLTRRSLKEFSRLVESKYY
jgi:hypothetical protein